MGLLGQELLRRRLVVEAADPIGWPRGKAARLRRLEPAAAGRRVHEARQHHAPGDRGQR